MNSRFLSLHNHAWYFKTLPHCPFWLCQLGQLGLEEDWKHKENSKTIKTNGKKAKSTQADPCRTRWNFNLEMLYYANKEIHKNPRKKEQFTITYTMEIRTRTLKSFWLCSKLTCKFENFIQISKHWWHQGLKLTFSSGRQLATNRKNFGCQLIVYFIFPFATSLKCRSFFSTCFPQRLPTNNDIFVAYEKHMVLKCTCDPSFGRSCWNSMVRCECSIDVLKYIQFFLISCNIQILFYWGWKGELYT